MRQRLQLSSLSRAAFDPFSLSPFSPLPLRSRPDKACISISVTEKLDMKTGKPQFKTADQKASWIIQQVNEATAKLGQMEAA